MLNQDSLQPCLTYVKTCLNLTYGKYRCQVLVISATYGYLTIVKPWF